MKFIAGAVGGLILAILGTVLVTIASAAAGDAVPGVAAFFVCWAAGIGVAVRAPTAAKAWRRLLVTAAVMSFMLPLSGLIFTGHIAAQMIQGAGQDAGAVAAGAAIGGGLVSGALGFLGFFLGLVFLVIGLLVGRDKQVVYVQGPPPKEE